MPTGNRKEYAAKYDGTMRGGFEKDIKDLKSPSAQTNRVLGAMNSMTAKSIAKKLNKAWSRTIIKHKD